MVVTTRRQAAAATAAAGAPAGAVPPGPVPPTAAAPKAPARKKAATTSGVTKSKAKPKKKSKAKKGKVAQAAEAALGQEADEDEEAPAPGNTDEDGVDGNPSKGKSKKTSKKASKKRKRSPTPELDDEDVEETDDSDPPTKRLKKAKIPERPESSTSSVTSSSVELEATVWPPREVFATVETFVDCQFQKEDARLRVSLEVHSDPGDFQCRLGYRARLELLPPAKGKGKANDQQKATFIGYIHAWRIDKPTAAYPTTVKNIWRDRLLTRKAPPTLIETSYCMRALYSEDDTVKEVLEPRLAELRDSSLLFIEMIHIRAKFQGNGLLRHALSRFLVALAELPEWFAFAGTIVLVPERPQGKIGNSWGEMSDDDVRDTLIGVYRRCGGYERWVNTDIQVGPGTFKQVTVMGRTVGIPDEGPSGSE